MLTLAYVFTKDTLEVDPSAVALSIFYAIGAMHLPMMPRKVRLRTVKSHSPGLTALTNEPNEPLHALVPVSCPLHCHICALTQLKVEHSAIGISFRR